MASARKPNRRYLSVEEAARPMYATAATSLSNAEERTIRMALNILERRMRTTDVVLESPAAVRQYVTLQMGALEHEVFAVLLLDNRHRLIATEFLFRGTLCGASVHPREVLKVALAHNAAAVCFFHGHPSQNPEPSQADELITARLRDVLALAEIRTLDHFVVGGSKCVSFAERGLL